MSHLTWACYLPALDVIRLPELARFDEPADFYSTAAHEHVQWTGHRSRLGRDLSGRFGDRAYGAEELVAELGVAFWCAQFELEPATWADHASYLGDWLAILRQFAPGPSSPLRPDPAGDGLSERLGWLAGCARTGRYRGPRLSLLAREAG